jgi:hypothetical protein
LERRQKGSQFKIIDSAHFPEKPHKPKFSKIMLIALIIGGGLGIGLTIALDLMDTSFKNATDLENYLQIPIICSLPMIQLEHEKQTAKRKAIIWGIAASISTITTILGIGYLWYKGLIII